MIRVVGSTGSDGKTMVWFFVIRYTQHSYTSRTRLNRKGAVTFFYNMTQREKAHGTATSTSKTPIM